MNQSNLFSAAPGNVLLKTLPQAPATYSNADAITQLFSLIPALGESDRRFATSLVSSYRQWRSLTPAQWPHVHRLIERATAPAAAPADTVQLGSFTAVVELFARAAKKLKFPKVRLLLDAHTPVILAVAGARSAAPGTITVTGEGSYPDRTWYGRVHPTGQWEPARNITPATMAALSSLLTQFGSDPDTTAAAYGRATNTCCFCRAELTDARSVAAGYGPVCAGNYGLSAAWNTAARTSEAQPMLAGMSGGVTA